MTVRRVSDQQLAAVLYPTSSGSHADAAAVIAEVRAHGVARVVDTLLPSVVAFCAPVFDARGHLAMGITSLGAGSRFDPDWDGRIGQPLKALAAQLSHDLGYHPAKNS